MRGTEVLPAASGDADGSPGGDVLSAFVASTRPLGRTQVALPPGVSAVCWGVALVDVMVGGWAAILLQNGWTCSGFLCALSTLGGRPSLLLTLSVGCVLATLLLAALTGGLVRAGGGQLAALVLTSVVGTGAAIGAVLAFLLVLVALAVGVVALIALLERH